MEKGQQEGTYSTYTEKQQVLTQVSSCYSSTVCAVWKLLIVIISTALSSASPSNTLAKIKAKYQQKVLNNKAEV